MIEGKEIRLFDGRYEEEAAPGSATKIRTVVFHKPVEGDVNGNGEIDTVLLLRHDPGGSGTFYYVAAALNLKSGYRGTNAVLIGDRVAPQSVLVRNGVVVVNYADRRSVEPMSTPPSVGKSKHLIFKNGELTETESIGDGEQVVEGWVTMGHEVRSFVPCQEKTDLWLLGNSPALQDVMDTYRKILPKAKPYTPIFMILAGKFAKAPTDGFGAEYEGAFLVAQLVHTPTAGHCRSEWIVVGSPLAGEVVHSPLRIQGCARGPWFFEGDFPVVLEDLNGEVIAKGFVTAMGEWMTEKFVRFEGAIDFEKPRSVDRGTLILKKDNPTGLPRHDDAVEIPVFFK
jgi:hypothetical protein